MGFTVGRLIMELPPPQVKLSLLYQMDSSTHFVIDRKAINTEFYLSKYQTFRNWYFIKFNKEQLHKYKDQFYKSLEVERKITPFIQWFYENHWLEFNQQGKILALDGFYKNWQKIDGTQIRSLHPPSDHPN